MNNSKLQMPMLLPALGFVAGCLLFKWLDVGIITPLAIFLVSGVIVIWRGWGVALLVMLVALGGVRIGIDEPMGEPKSEWGSEQSVWGDLRESAITRVGDLELSVRADILVRAMVLGDRDMLTSRQREAYVHSGASHILAVSGLHISVIFMFVNILLLPLVLLARGHIVRNILVVLLIWLYAAFVGFSPSVTRSAIMFSVLQFSWVTGRPYSGVNALLFTLFAAVVVEPTLIYSLGFQLSVVAVAAIFFWAMPLYYRLFSGGGFLVGALCIGVACGVATMPLVSHTFGYVALLGVAFSPVFVVTSFLIITFGVVWLLFPFEVISPIVRFFVEMGAMIQERGVEAIAGREWGVLDYRLPIKDLYLIYLIFIVITMIVWSRPSGEKGQN